MHHNKTTRMEFNTFNDDDVVYNDDFNDDASDSSGSEDNYEDEECENGYGPNGFTYNCFSEYEDDDGD